MEIQQNSISVIIPSYNEGESLRDAVLTNLETFRGMGFDFELILVDDNSTDQSPAIARELAASHPEVTALRHSVNKGAGGAFRTGIAAASKEFVIFAPVDNPLQVEDMDAYVPRMAVSDVIVGRRNERVGYSRLARFASYVYNRILVALLFNLGVDDVNWIQVYRRSLFEDKILRFDSDRLFFLVEILVHARRNRLVVTEVPARMRKRIHGRATCTRPKIILKTFVEMVTFFCKLKREERRQ